MGYLNNEEASALAIAGLDALLGANGRAVRADGFEIGFMSLLETAGLKLSVLGREWLPLHRTTTPNPSDERWLVLPTSVQSRNELRTTHLKFLSVGAGLILGALLGLEADTDTGEPIGAWWWEPSGLVLIDPDGQMHRATQTGRLRERRSRAGNAAGRIRRESESWFRRLNQDVYPILYRKES